jgi:hypothetical protein
LKIYGLSSFTENVKRRNILSLIYSNDFLDLIRLKNFGHPLANLIFLEFFYYLKKVNPSWARQFSAFDGDLFEHMGNDDEISRLPIPGLKIASVDKEEEDID